MQTYAREIGVYALAVYHCLASHADSKGECFPSSATVAEELAISQRQFFRELEKLQALGLIEVEDRTQSGKGKVTSVYRIPLAYWDRSGHMTVSHMGGNVAEGHMTHSQEHMTVSHNPYDSQSYPHMTDSHMLINKTRINENQLTTPIAGASQNGGGGGGIEDRLRSFTFDDNQIRDSIIAMGDRLTDALLDQWQDVIDYPPKGLDNPVAAMVARLRRGNAQVPLKGKPATNGRQAPPASAPETTARLQQEKESLMQQYSGPPRLKHG